MDVSLIAPDVWKELYTPRSRVGEFKRDNTFRVLDKDGSGIADEDIMEHTRHRRMLSHAFSEKALRGQEGIMQGLVDMLVSGLKSHIKEHGSEPVNMTKKYNWATFDVIGDLAFGQPFGCLEADSPHYVISMVNDLFYHMIRTQPFKRFPLLRPFQSLIASPSNAITTVQKFEKFAFETIKKRIENGDSGRKDFISYMLPHNSTGEFTEAELTSNAAALMIAGSETTATTLTGGTYFLLKNPSVYQRLVQEIRSSFKEEKDITISELDNLPYLAAVLTETLRIFPPVPGIMSRVIPKGGKHLCGYWLPGKVRYFLDILSALLCLALLSQLLIKFCIDCCFRFSAVGISFRTLLFAPGGIHPRTVDGGSTVQQGFKRCISTIFSWATELYRPEVRLLPVCYSMGTNSFLHIVWQELKCG